MYRITNDRLEIEEGIIGKYVRSVELYRIKDPRYTRSVLQALLGYGEVWVIIDDDPFSFPALRGSRRLHALLRSACTEAAGRQGVVRVRG